MGRSSFSVRAIVLAGILWQGLPGHANAVVLYDQDFESPANFVNDAGDVNISTSVNQNYGDQPPGFTFAQANTVETLLLTGTAAFGTGYSDPAGTGGNYALGMLSDFQNDKLGLSFNVGSNDFLNISLDVSSIDLSVFSGPFVPSGAVPLFQFTLYDNPSGTAGLLGNSTILDSVQASGTASAQTVFDWTRILLPLDASASTTGNVTLNIDLLEGGYAALDNFAFSASNTPIPEPTTALLMGLGLAGLGWRGRTRQS